jgi:hypothetical protein
MKLAGSMGELTQDEKLSAFRKATNSVEERKTAGLSASKRPH